MEDGGSKPKYETRLRKTDKTRTGGSSVWEEVKVKIDPTNPANVPSMDELPPQEESTSGNPQRDWTAGIDKSQPTGDRD
jgi:hypothetical protein